MNTMEETMDRILADPEWLDSALIRLPRRERIELAGLLGQLAQEPIDEELREVTERMTEIVREAADDHIRKEG